MKKFAVLAIFAMFALLLPAVTMAQPPSFTVAPSSLDFGVVTIGQSATINVTITNTSGASEVVDGNALFTLLSAIGSFQFDFWVTAPGVGTVKFQPNIVTMPSGATDVMKSIFFLPAGISVASGQSLILSYIIMPLVAGSISDTLDIMQRGPVDPLLLVSVTGVPPPSPPLPRVWIKPFVNFNIDYPPAIKGDSTGFPTHGNWGGDTPEVFYPEKWEWFDASDSLIATGKDPWLWGLTGTRQNITLKGTSAGGVTCTSMQEVYFDQLAPPPSPPEPPAVIPAEPEYRPSQSSAMAVSANKAGGRSEKRKGGYWGVPAGKPLAGVQSASWGEIKRLQTGAAKKE